MSGLKEIFKSDPRARTPTAFTATSPAFRMSAQLDSEGRSIGGGLTRLGTDTQKAADARFPRILGDLDALRGTVKPGFSDLRKAALASVRNRRSEAIGNLRENLGRRRIAGSSFGEDALIRAERDFAEQEAQTQAQSFLQELQANTALIRQESEQIFNQLQRELSEAGMSANFISSVGNIVNSNTRFAEEARLNQLAGQAKLGTDLLFRGLDTFAPLPGGK